MSRKRAAVVWTLVGLATLLTLVCSLTIWAKRQLLDTNAWTKTSSRLLDNAEVRTALSNDLVNLLNQRVDVTAALRQRLPKQAQATAPAIAVAVQAAAVRGIDAFLGTAAAQRLWEEANRRAHKRIVDVLEEKDVGPLETTNGAIVLDLRPMVQSVAARLGIGDRLKASASPTTGQIVLVRSDQLDTAQKAVKVFRALTIFLVIVVFALYAAAIYIGRGRRRIVLAVSACTLIVVGLIELAVRRLVGNAVVDSYVKTAANRPAVHAIWAIGTDMLRDIAIALIAYGLIALLVAWLGGGSRPAVAVRRFLAPVFARWPVAVFVVAFTIYLIVVAWTPVGDNRRLIGLTILAALLLIALEVWRRQMAREFPDAGGPQPEPATATKAPPEGGRAGSRVDELERLARLHSDGVLTDSEFESQKADLLRT
jgi:hypothetical protein